MNMDFNLPGFRGELKDTGMYEIQMFPQEIPFEQGIAVYEIRSQFNFEVGDTLNYCDCIVNLESLQSQIRKPEVPLLIGDTLLEISQEQQLNIVKFHKEFIVNLKKNEMNRLGALEISTSTTDDFEEMKQEMFYIIHYVINMLSLTYNIPIKPMSFMFKYNILNIFTIIEAQSKNRIFQNFVVNPTGNEQKWNSAVYNYRKSLSSNDPQSKFLWLYIACETLRSLIKEKIGLAEETKQIVGKGYKEPVIDRALEYNTTPIFPNIVGKTYASILYGSFRELRNAAAHHLLDDGTSKNLIELKDYIEYYSAVPYLAEVFQGYISELYKLN